MSPINDTPMPGEVAARDAVRALSREHPDDAFRARLRHEFVSGRIGRRRGLAPGPWFARPGVLIPFAAGVLLALVTQANRGPDWRVVAANGEGRVWVGERTFAPGETLMLSRALRRGGRVRVEGAMTLDVVAPGVAAVAIAPGTDVTLSAAANRLWSRAMSARVERGDAYFTTGAAFRGAVLDVATAEVNVRAVGTAFAVLRHAEGSCVCVMEGHVHVGLAGSPEAAMSDVPAGMRRVVGSDRKAETLPILEDSVHQLHDQRARAGETLGR